MGIPSQNLLKSPHKVLDIEEDIINLIRKNELRTGDRLSAEKRLSEIYNVTLYQVRKAVKNLIAKGFLYSVPKSGIFVKGNNDSKENQPIHVEGFNLFDIKTPAKCKIKFLVGQWHATDLEFWKKTISTYSEKHDSIEIVPLFPRGYDEYLELTETSDLMLTTPWELFRSYRNYSNIEPFHPDDAATWPVDPKYLTVLTNKNGITGIPIYSVFLMGSINNQVISDSFTKRLLNAGNWEELFTLFEMISRKHPQLKALNLHHIFTFSAYHLIRVAGGKILNRNGTGIDMGSSHIIKVLEMINNFRHTVIDPEGNKNGQYRREYIADIDYDIRNAIIPERLQRIPWLYPVDNSEKSYPEALSIGCVLKHSHYIDESKKFLRYLLENHIQEEMNECPAMNCISNNMQDNLFKNYPSEWKSVLKSMKEKTFVFGEYIPGYNEFLHTVFHPEMKRFFQGLISVKEVVNVIREKGNEVIDSARVISETDSNY